MFQTYEQIFKKRADAYHKAMELYPAARDREFQLAIDAVNIQAGEIVCDAPAGGGYLRDYLPEGVQKYIAVEPAPDFARHCPSDSINQIIKSPLNSIAMKSESVDVVVSLAGTHHMEDKTVFFREAARILRPGGRFVIADAETGTGTDRFLNQFVDQHNSMGHKGMFLGKQTVDEITASGLEVHSDELVNFPWSFDSREDMGIYCKLLFGMDLADPETVSQDIEDLLGLIPGTGRVNMAWCLRCIVAIRP